MGAACFAQTGDAFRSDQYCKYDEHSQVGHELYLAFVRGRKRNPGDQRVEGIDRRDAVQENAETRIDEGRKQDDDGNERGQDHQPDQRQGRKGRQQIGAKQWRQRSKRDPVARHAKDLLVVFVLRLHPAQRPVTDGKLRRVR